jgi:hypothetical protein
MQDITLPKWCIPILKNENLKDEFVAGVISIMQGEEPKASCPYMEEVFFDLVHGRRRPKVIPGIPQFDPTGMKNNELERYKKVQAGKVPSGGLNHSYKNLQFKPITTLDKNYLNKLYNDCQDIIKKGTATAEYRRFIIYLAEVMEHCADSDEM